jgi:hypothetical protein
MHIQGLVLGYCFHQLTGQRFSRENLSSFLAGTRRWEKRRVFLGADLENVKDLSLDQFGGGAKLATLYLV